MNGDNNALRCFECGGYIPNKEPDYSRFISTGLCLECREKAVAEMYGNPTGETRAAIADMKESLVMMGALARGVFVNLSKIEKPLE